jgi:hypothetical protein
MEDKDLFGYLLKMLQVGALQQIGLIENPLTGNRRRNLQAAKQSIAMIDMIQRRMKLSEEEAALADEVIMDLRLRYVAAREQDKKINDAPTE